MNVKTGSLTKEECQNCKDCYAFCQKTKSCLVIAGAERAEENFRKGQTHVPEECPLRKRGDK